MSTPGPPGPSRSRARPITPLKRAPAPTPSTSGGANGAPASTPASASDQPRDGTDFTKPLPPPRQIGTLRDGGGVRAVPGGGGGAGAGRGQVQKLKFLPKLPASRYRKEVEDVKPPTPPVTTHGSPFPGLQRGRGAPLGSSRGPHDSSMTASGPFALGPSALSSFPRRPTRSLPPSIPFLPPSTTPSRRPAIVPADAEKYSDDDEDGRGLGIEIVDLDMVEGMDDMAPVSLKRMRVVRGEPRVKRGGSEAVPSLRDSKGKGKAKPEPEDDTSASTSLRPTAEPESPPSPVEEGDRDRTNALDLDESDEGEEMEDMLEDFIYAHGGDDLELEDDPTKERFYFFQFPAPFPTFVQPLRPGETVDVTMDDADAPEVVEPPEEDLPEPEELAQSMMKPTSSVGEKEKEKGEKGKKAVSFAKDVKPESASSEKGKGKAVPPAPAKAVEGDVKEKEKKLSKAEAAKLPPPRLDGLIGHLEVYASGQVRIVLGTDIALEVHPAAETAFLENVVHLDPVGRQMTALGRVERRFVVSPDLERLLEEMELGERVKEEEERGGAVKLE